MKPFQFHNPSKIIFGPNQISKLTQEIDAKQKVLLLYGQGSIKRNGIYEEVMSALSHCHVLEFSGIEPNPSYETLMRAVQMVKEEKIGFLLSVGGGSVLDGTKFVAVASLFEGDPWDILTKRASPKKALPLGAVLTLPATGSEMNPFSVISRKETSEKFGFGTPLVYPKFSILDPNVMKSLPAKQIANGIVDAYVHVMEQYLTAREGTPLQDRLAESLLQTLVEVGPLNLSEHPTSEDRENLMWCATMALNGLIGSGVSQDWATHTIGHELTAFYGLDHAQTLALVLPALLTVTMKKKSERLKHYGKCVFGIHEDQDGSKAIACTRHFFESLGVPTKLSSYGLSNVHLASIIKRFEHRSAFPLGEQKDIFKSDLESIFELLS